MQGRNNIFISNLLFALSVPKCVSCRARLTKEDRALCPSCKKQYNNTKSRNCSLCAKRLNRCSCTNDYLSKHFVRGLAKVYRYRQAKDFSAANSLVYKLKHDNREDVIDFVSDELLEAIKSSLPTLPENTLVTHVPNRKSAIIERGFDHAESLGREVARKLGLEFIPLLVSLSKKPQKEMSIDERLKNAKFDLICEPDLKGRIVLIIDDVVTSGASMGNAATMIRALKPKAIYGAAVAIAYQDNQS